MNVWPGALCLHDFILGVIIFEGIMFHELKVDVTSLVKSYYSWLYSYPVAHWNDWIST